MQQPNPITSRLAVLQSQWGKFAEEEGPCLLRWVLADPHDLPLVTAFFDVEETEAALFPDLFLKLESRFEHRSRYGRALALELALRYRQMREGLAEAGAVTNWRPPAARRGGGDVTRLYDVARSFHAYHEPFYRRVVLHLAPAAIADRGAWAAWLAEAVAEHPGPEVRLLVVEDSVASVLGALAEAEPRRVCSQTLRLGLHQATEELSEQAGLKSFGGKLRHLILKISRAWAEGDAGRAEELGKEALEVTALLNWPSLAFTVHYLMGSGYLGIGQPVEAGLRFQLAEQAAVRAEERDEPGARTLRLNARMSLGAVLVSQNAFARAARLYEESVPFAATPETPQLHIECWRMAAHAHEQCGQTDQAWEALLKALAVGNVLDLETRKTTTLPFVGEALMRLAAGGRYGQLGQVIDENLGWLLGEDWRDRARASGETAPP
jgi:hypothetical protein